MITSSSRFQTMAPYAQRAGSTAALLGTVQFAIGAGVGALVSTLHNGTALPMVGAIALCGVAALLCLQLLVLRPLAAPALP